MGCCGTSETKENTSPNRIIKGFSKENCQNITSSLPTRTNTDLQSLKDEMKSKTKNLSQTEKSYVAFLWECQNIDYDAQGYFSGANVDCSPEGVFKNGKTVCSGYSRLYKELATYLELTVECIPCYSKGVGYEPGKKLTTIHLLSGGEKTLTAISLLFAILNVKEVPFCIFDEVEAALDEANVEQFGNYLNNYNGKTEFLIITHKKKTMEYAKTLYGITMQESGVSKLVSVNLEEKK